MNKKLTVLITVFNEDFCILNALRSIKANKIYPEVDIVIIDDCSSNATTIRILDLLKTFSKFRIFRSPKNLGLSNSRNLGFEKALAEIVVPLDADDTLPEKTLDKIYKAFNDNPEANFIYGNYIIDSKDSKIIVNSNDITRDRICDLGLLLNNWILLGTSPCKKSLWRVAGGYSQKYANSCQDVDFWIKAVKNKGIGYFLDEIIYNWNRNSHGMNETFDRADYYQLLDEHFNFISRYRSRASIANEISFGLYRCRKPKDMFVANTSYFWNISFKNHLRLFFLIIKLL